MTGQILSLRSKIAGDLKSAVSGLLDTSFLGDAVGKPYQWGEAPVEAHSFVMHVSREMAIDAGIIEPTPQEKADRSASRERSRTWHAARTQKWAEWFTAIQAAAGPIGAAILNLHTPDDHGNCEECSSDEYWDPWPCTTVDVAAGAAGLPEPVVGF